MPARNKTSLGLNQWIGSEYPKRIDFVEDNKIINDELENRVKKTDLATETEPGIITYAKVKEIAPKPDLSPYIPFTKGYKDVTADNFVVRCDLQRLKSPHFIKIYDGNGEESGEIHLNGSRLKYRSKNRNNYGWNDVMDNHDMTARDHRMDSIDTILKNDTVRDVRLVNLINCTVWNANQANERAGYVITGIVNHNNDSAIDTVQMRALQVRRGGDGNRWYNVPFG